MAYAITDQWFIPMKSKLLFRQADIIKLKNTQAELPKFNEKDIEDIKKMIGELEELKMLRKLPLDEQFDKLEQTEEKEKEEEEPDIDDIFMQKLEGNYKKSTHGDKLMQKLGATNG